jgi:hypothetical protein
VLIFQKYVTASIFDPNDESGMYLQNVVDTAYFHVGQRHKSKRNISELNCYESLKSINLPFCIIEY